MKRFDLTLIVEGVVINYSFFDRGKMLSYLQTALDTGKVETHYISEAEVSPIGPKR